MENVAEKQHGLLELLRIRLNPAIEDLGYELYDLEDLQYQGQRFEGPQLQQLLDQPRCLHTHVTVVRNRHVDFDIDGRRWCCRA